MSNFNFLKHEWPYIFKEANEAERLTFTSPKACTIICRSAMEKAIQWLYANDPDLKEPYNNTLSSLMHEQCFKDILKPSMFYEINLIRKTGNNAAHGNSIKTKESLITIKNLYRFLSYLASYYAEEEPSITPFDESLIPKGNEEQMSKEALKTMAQRLERQNKKAQEEQKQLEEQAQIILALQQKIEKQQQEIRERKTAREKVVNPATAFPLQISESITRKLYIDQALKEAGWTNLREGYEIEYEVKGMPLSTNASGIGYVDYVLWGDDGKPLAVIEAKRAMAEPERGKHQAVLYADCLEKMHGQRPLIYYTNGFETYFWDDTFYPARRVFGFHTKNELQLAIDRRNSRKDIRKFKVNESITGRYYQKEAIQRVAEAFVNIDKRGNLTAGSRKALLVMATGSGKTRTSASITDMLTKCNWAKRILFLADRNALVTQAKNAFAEHLPHLSSIDLTKEREDNGTRLVFSTYPTIMNKIDSVKSEDNRFYGIGHFDMIIIDEAHRSVYQKYGAISEYFDSLLVGLTATPKTEIDRNTYSLFEIEDDNPTYAYELDQAVADGFLKPPKAMGVPIHFLREGIRYDELSDREKEEYEEKFGDPTSGEAPDEISSNALNSWLFNTTTVDIVLNHLMNDGIKVEGGDKLGKTIIFAKNHEHAQFIEKRFNQNYPQYEGKFLRVIDNYESKAQDLLDQFVDPHFEYNPQIAVSVDMMDTGVDAPRVVNLVFFKLVKSYSKFWQMIGRGTRLCPDLFGPGLDKDHFVIFDYCQNFEFFNENPDGVEGHSVRSLTQRIFELKLDVIVAIREIQDISEEQQWLDNYFTDQLYNQVKELDRERFQVNMELKYVIAYSEKRPWQTLTAIKVIEIKEHISKLLFPMKEDHELARRFDIIILNLQLATLLSRDAGRYINKVASIAQKLCKINIPEVKAKDKILKDLQTDLFWEAAHVKRLDEVRVEIRELMNYLESDAKLVVYSSLKDSINTDGIVEHPILELSTTLHSYQERVKAYIRNNKKHLTIQKLRNNEPITEKELHSLEVILFDGSERGTKEDFEREYGEQPLGQFIRSIVGLDIKAANEAFSEFISRGNLRADQMTFISNIISFLTTNGTIDKRMLFEPPFTDVNDQGLMGVFDDADSRKVISIIERINGNAGVA